MQREPEGLAGRNFDVVVVGGGIFGACAAWEAVQRGLSVALLEKGDFSGATSANHFKMIHGGIRYLQHGDIKRVRESSHERSSLIRAVPHLAYPLPIVVPTYGRGRKGKLILKAGLMAYDLLTLDRNRGIRDPARRVPSGHLLSRAETLERFPHIPPEGLTGAAILYDGQMYNPPRIALAFIRSAVEAGAAACNYVEVEDFIREGERITGVVARDRIGGTEVRVRGRIVLNAAGPWANRLLRKSLDLEIDPSPTFSRDLAFVVPRRLDGRYGLACQIESRDTDALVDRGGRHIFLMPWRGHTLVGVWHLLCKDSPDEFKVSEQELREFVREANTAYPGLDITIDAISIINTGLILFGAEGAQGAERISFGKRSRLVDHAESDRIDGLVTLIGVRATVARGMAEEAVTLILRKLGRPRKSSRTAYLPVFGGRIDDFEALVREAAVRVGDSEVARALVHNYGSEYPRVLAYAEREPSLEGTLSGATVLKAEAVHAVREEMALRLEDVVLRRTELGTAGDADPRALEECARIMAAEIGWDRERVDSEVDEVRGILERRGPWHFVSEQQNARGT